MRHFRVPRESSEPTSDMFWLPLLDPATGELTCGQGGLPRHIDQNKEPPEVELLGS